MIEREEYEECVDHSDGIGVYANPFALVSLGSGVSAGVMWGFDFIFAIVLITLGMAHTVWINRGLVRAG